MDTLFSSDTLTVSALNAQVRQLLELSLQQVWVGGEVSNLTRASSGHYYFNLKDEKAQVRCALFKGYASKLQGILTEGAQVELTGKITLYEARGEFQITVTDIRFAGLGKLFEAYEKLKATLQEEGLFNAERKKTLPSFPRTIGIVTSPAAAALRDVVSTLRRRMYNPQIILYPTPVQGVLSEHSIAQAIRTANMRNEVDVLIVCRGGGSIEDLWAFNEEVVARAVAESILPIVSGVGHETDFTITDFVADIRAPTPTAAAELASYDFLSMMQNLQQYRSTLKHFMLRIYENYSQTLDSLSRHLVHPQKRLEAQKDQLVQYHTRLNISIQNVFRQKKYDLALAIGHLPKLDNLRLLNQQKLLMQQTRLNEQIRDTLHQAKINLKNKQLLLDAIAPQKVLERGYAIVRNGENKVVSNAEQTKPYEKLKVVFADSELQVSVSPENMRQDELPL